MTDYQDTLAGITDEDIESFKRPVEDWRLEDSADVPTRWYPEMYLYDRYDWSQWDADTHGYAPLLLQSKKFPGHFTFVDNDKREFVELSLEEFELRRHTPSSVRQFAIRATLEHKL